MPHRSNARCKSDPKVTRDCHVPKTHLTDLLCKTARAPGAKGRVVLWDKTLPNFGLRLNTAGRKSWVVITGEKRALKTFGAYPDVTLAAAREQARELLSAPPTTAITCKEAVDLFLAACGQKNRPRTISEYKRHLERHFIPKLGKRPLASIETNELAKLIDGLIRTPAEQNHAHTIAAIFFKWAERRTYVNVSPMSRLQLPSKLTTRERILNSEELKAVWLATEPYSTHNAIVRLCILTGQRRGEIGSLKWEYFSSGLCTLPGKTTKNHRTHVFPILPMAQAVIDQIPNTGAFLFQGRDDKGKSWQGWAKGKRALDEASGVKDFTLHDLRRTASSQLAALKVQPHIIERILNHSTGTISGIAAIYNRHSYLDEMREALQTYETHLATFLNRE